MSSNAIDISKLYGTWRIVGSRAVDANGVAARDPWGPQPMGRLVLSRTGRMIAVLCDGRVTVPEGEKRLYSSYCGNFRVEDDFLTTTVDAASDATRIGSQQRRRLSFRGDLLVLTPPRENNGDQREIFWEFESPAQ